MKITFVKTSRLTPGLAAVCGTKDQAQHSPLYSLITAKEKALVVRRVRVCFLESRLFACFWLVLLEAVC